MLPPLRYLWPLPWTLVGLVMAGGAAVAGARLRWVDGALEVCGGGVARICARLPASLRFEAITLGHVIVGLHACELDAVRAHEHVHVRQYERWGWFFVPAYLLASGWQWWHGRDPYRDNPFEQQAYAAAPVHAPDSGCPATRNNPSMVE